MKQRHKTECAILARHEAELIALDIASMFPSSLNVDCYVPTFKRVDDALHQWVKVHDFLLMATTIHALDLPRDNTRSRTHMLWLTLAHRGNLEDVPSKNFRITDANVISISKVASMGKDHDREWNEALNLVAVMRDRSDLAGLGEIAVVAIECPPLGPQILPVGSLLKDYSGKQVLPNWKNILIECVERGGKVEQFGF